MGQRPKDTNKDLSPKAHIPHFLLAPLLFILLSGCASLFYTPPEPVEDFSLATPEEAYESFKKAVSAENDVLIWRTISDKRRQEDGITWSDYWTFKDLVKVKFGDAFDLLAESELKEVIQRGNQAQLHLVAEKNEAYVVLVRESYYEFIIDRPGYPIRRHYDFLDHGAPPFIARSQDGIQVNLPLSPDEPLPEGDVVDFRILDEWRFYSVTEPSPIPDP